MSLRTGYRLCPNCGRFYPFDPDSGRLACPHCGVKQVKKLLDLKSRRERKE